MAISSDNHTAKEYMTFRLYAWQCLKASGGAKSLLVIIPKVVISLLMVSRGIISFKKKRIAVVGTTNNNMLSKRKTLDVGSLLSSKSETQHDHRFSSTPYVPMDPGIGSLFNSPCVQIVLVFVCIK